MKYLKNTLRILPVMLLAGMATTGCEPSYNEYYVRYAVGIEPGDVVNINYQDTYNHHGEITGVVKEAEVEGIVGPVYGGFKANITATVNDGEAPVYLRIEVSENGAPYRTLAEQNGATTLSWSIPLDEDK